MELWQLIARESIRDLVARYNANGDTGRFAQVRELFSPPATMVINPGGTFTGIEEVMTIFTGTADSTSVASGLTHVRHSTTTHQIDLIDEAHATQLQFLIEVHPLRDFFDAAIEDDERNLVARDRRSEITTIG